ncbi:MAG: phage adaptor protein [Allosphingosinicella sp.]
MPSDPTTWAELKASLANWLDRDDLSEVEIPEAIALAERRFQRTLFSPEREVTADLIVDAEAVMLPADLWGVRAIFLATDPKTVLEPMTLAELRNRYAANATGRPRNYAISGEQILFGPAPDASYTAKLTYFQTIPAVDAGQPSNWLLTDHPDVYLFGALHELHLLLADDARAAIYESKFRQAADEVNGAAVRRTRGGAPIRLRPPVVV